MRNILTFITLTTILACNDNRAGIPENLRNYTEISFYEYDSTCMTASDGIFVFKNLNVEYRSRTGDLPDMSGRSALLT
jgi:hypothetical protein